MAYNSCKFLYSVNNKLMKFDQCIFKNLVIGNSCEENNIFINLINSTQFLINNSYFIENTLYRSIMIKSENSNSNLENCTFSFNIIHVQSYFIISNFNTIILNIYVLINQFNS